MKRLVLAVLLDDDLALLFKAQEAVGERDDERNGAEHTKQVLRNEFIKKLKACCKEHKFDYDTHLRLFIASKGKASSGTTIGFSRNACTMSSHLEW